MLASLPRAHSEVVTSLTFSPHFSTAPSHDLLLCSTSGDDTAALWDGRLLITGTSTIASELPSSAAPSSSPSSASSPRGRVMALHHHRSPVNHALFAQHDSNLLLTCSDDRTVAMWDLRKPDSVVATLRGFSEGVNKMMWLPSNMCPHLTSRGCGGDSTDRTALPLLASACDDGMIYIHLLLPGGVEDAVSAQPVATTTMPTTSTTTAGTAAATSSLGTLVDKFFVSTSTVNDMVLLPRARGCPASERVLATASEDGAVRTWRLPFNSTATAEDRLLASLDEFNNPVNHLAIVPSATSWYATCLPDLAALADIDLGDIDHRGGGNEEGATIGAATAHGDEDAESSVWLLAACSENVFGVDAHVRSGAFGSGAIYFNGHTDYVRGMEFVPALRTGGTDATAAAERAPLLLTVSDDGTAIEWEMTQPMPTTFARATGSNTARIAAASLEEEETVADNGAEHRIHVSHRYGEEDEVVPGARGDADENGNGDDDAEDHIGGPETHDSANPEEGMQPGGEAIFGAQLHEGLIMASAVAPSDRSILATGSDTGDIKLWRVPLNST